MPMRDAFYAITAMALAAAWPLLGHAQGAGAYPSRQIQIIVPSGPGTGHDFLARVLGPRLADHWKVPVVTLNVVGATGNIGADQVAKSAPDGYNLMCVGVSFGTNPAVNANLPFDPIKSFAPVALLATSVMSVVVAPQLPVKSFGEFVDLVRSQPGKYFYGSPGNGTAQHLGMELLKRELQLDMVHVPYKTSAPAITDLIGGHVQSMIMALQTASPYVTNGKLRILATMSPERSPAFPDVPTMRSLGYPQLELEVWYGLFAPAGTPRDIVAKLNSEVNALLREPDMRELLAKQGQIAANGTPEQFAELVQKEVVRWKRVVGSAGIKAD
jgi:tripartite-type tricarboxylate transporter receptor subunit TctC